MPAQGGCPSWNGRLWAFQDETSRIQKSVGLGIVFAVAWRLIDKDELSVFSSEAGIQKVKSSDLVDRCIVNADQAKRRACRKSVFAETEKRMEFLPVSVGSAGFGVGSNQGERVNQS